MKYVIFLADGMADLPLSELDDHTPLEAANHPALDRLARNGVFGLARTVPDGMPAGSDTANLSVFGYDPTVCYSGRSPLEAVSMGIDLKPTDVTYRCNLVTLSDAENIEDAVMMDYSAGEIDSHSARELIEWVQQELECEGVRLYPGVSYRNCLLIPNGELGGEQTPPHDLSLKPVRGKLPKGANSDVLRRISKWSYSQLKNHPINRWRAKYNKPLANCLWFWGEGVRPDMETYSRKFGIQKGAVISAVDLIQGIGKCAGLDVIKVDGATGNYTTDFAAKGRAAIDAFKNGAEFVYIHIEAPDECGHHGQVTEKVWSIEQIDEKIVAPVLEYLDTAGETYAALAMPDHPTPICIRTHSPEPVPFALYFSDGRCAPSGAESYSEKNAAQTGVFEPCAHRLMEKMTKKI
ncbi:MAG: cofactor-independent phosphoglycerate mutase [Clostridia bacterium]|nr:cofactor-independent phosphoglycerate mutase [Clostridia bacterium]